MLGLVTATNKVLYSQEKNTVWQRRAEAFGELKWLPLCS